MHKYIIRYTDKEGDLTKVWVEASSVQDAKQQVLREYWDINNIVSINLI